MTNGPLEVPDSAGRITEELRTERVQAQQKWDESSATYDQIVGLGLISPREWSAWTHLFRRLLDPERHKRILDVGTGTGFLALLLAELGHEVTAIDISEQMLAAAERKAAEAGLAITFLQGDAYEPELGGTTFDAVVSRHVLWTLLQPERAVRAWMTLTAPRGQVVAVDGFFSDTTTLDRAARLLGQCLYAARTKRWPSLPPPNPNLPLRWARTLLPVRNIFERAGLRDVRTEMLEAIDRVERGAMTVEQHLRFRWRHYLVEGTIPGRAPP
jgi:ubiquinone/menaquinone biosynthesis C-methylase UbiE